HDHHVVSLAHSADGSRFAVSRGGAMFNRVECWSITADGPLTLAWALRNRQPLSDVEAVYFKHGGWFTDAVAFSPDSRILAIVDGESESGGPVRHQIHLRSA